MPVSTGGGGSERAKRCRHCEESGHRLDSGNLFWRIHLDQDLFDTIIAIYPEWFKDYNVNRTTMAEGGSGTAPDSGSPPHTSQGLPLSPPKAEVDDSPLQKSMDKNKESLKVKLMLRRPINQLVAQGIMPPLKTPPAFHEQRQKLERAKTGDLLKLKIQQRPDRQELVRQHILEDVGHVDPSLAERQRMLKKARLADSLNDQLSHRPGPLELIKKNILHTEEPIERAVKEGVIPFKATSEGQLTKPQHPNRYITFEEDSQSSEGGQSPLQAQPDVLEAAASAAGIVTVALTLPTTVVVSTASALSPLLAPAPSPLSLGSSTSSLSPLSSVPSPQTPITPRPAGQPAPGKDKNRKKSKSKSQPKTRTIKFHEYKGPPNAHKNSTINSTPVETSYELLLQQQQLFLQWQLEWQHKYPQIILPAAQKPPSVGSESSSLPGLIAVTSPSTSQNSSLPPPSPAPSPATPQQTTTTTEPPSPAPPRSLTNLEDWKVSDLKAELKRRNLTVSGSKPQLIERLKQFSELPSTPQQDIPVNHMGDESLSGVSMDTPLSPTSLALEDESLTYSPGNQQSPVSQTMSPETPCELDMDTSPSPAPPPGSPQQSEDIIRDQQRKIEELQRQLLQSQLQLQKIRNNGIIIKPEKQQKLFLQQHLQNKKQQQQLQLQLQQLQQQQHMAFQQQQQQSLNAKASLAAFLQNQSQHQQQLANLLQHQTNGNKINNNNCSNNNNNNNNVTTSTNNKKNNVVPKSIVLDQNQTTTAFIINQLNLQKQKTGLSNGAVGHQRTASLPNFFGSFVNQHPQQPQQQSVQATVTESSKPSQSTFGHSSTEPRFSLKPPPQYEEATKQLKGKQETLSSVDSTAKSSSERPKNVKSQIVDDVLEILIKNGELPPSAAQDPATPTTPGRTLPHGLLFNPATGTNTSASGIEGPEQSPPAPPPPPPPPLPHSTFAITLPTSIALTTSQTDSNVNSLNSQFSEPDSLDFLLRNSDNFSPESLAGSVLVPPVIDLKELGLDLETFDTMDFGQLDCSDLSGSVKIEPSTLLDSVTDMEIGVSGDASDVGVKTEGTSIHDQLMSSQSCELMDIGEMPMDMDDPDWLESLMPTEQCVNGNIETTSVTTPPPHQSVFHVPCNTNSSCHYNHSNVDLDPLLSNSQDPFDLFNIDDPEIKIPGDLNAVLGWDKVDFAT